ncbi:MAG: chloride channel protein [Prevotella sp.]|jgi:chloride channel protein, CIC family|uniref:chloride channel protein n=1 Tax=Leyella stercorea TaxID=363265 RepID=UPI001F1DD4AA|nr:MULTISPECIES: chloride channel protein [Prevotellaceae]MCF2644873.1 chloride channel protein [Leyella stercorea]MCI6130250.1 chloride channel protein [Prevotella sp.]MDD6199541.1 chloride channel protein [Prevotella sp.]MDY3968925.1 chloride channel protein [Prevotella sp.]
MQQSVSSTSAIRSLGLRLYQWRIKHLSDRQATIILAFFIGFFASVAAFLLHSLIHEIQQLLTSRFHANTFNWMYLMFPVVGIFLTSLFVRYVVKDNISHGITRILYAISSKQSRLKAHNCWTSVVASAITIGFGGSVGAEAPIVLTGSAIGSNLGRFFRMDNKTLMLLVGCGAAAAIAGIFKAPIAGLVFTLEVLMVDLSMASLLPILTAAVTATCFTYVFMGSDSLFTFHLDSGWVVERVPASIILGVVCGLVSLYFIRSMSVCEGIFGRMKQHRWGKLALGGLMLSSLIFLFPVLYGEGYSAINILLNGSSEADWNEVLKNSMFYGNGHLLILFIALVIFTKTFATAATNGGGGCGGTFAPSLFVGAFSGFLFSRLWNMYQIGTYIPEKNFTLLGMAGVMAGVMHAPLTGIFLIAEITNGYDLFMPLMIVAVSSVMTISIFEPHSIYAMRLAREGKLVTHHTDKSVLTLMSMDSVIERDYTAVDPDMPLGRLVNAISKSHTSFIPVLNAAGSILGEIDITKIRHVMFRAELYNKFTVRQLMQPIAAQVAEGDSMEEVMRKFDLKGTRYLPVVNTAGHITGYISRSRAYSMYRKMVADFSNE